ncbi:hypothetical protein DSO57_1012176 [Entomophthora muscae]|uniref:Uncharacterized protein n=1 Tax=Entomophthora muscae TaxID=34485 RepID=A0ACC2TH49_9FUNG|nr:hypothetical protein DSO57_1012176 [Entomophthora muscae]
MQLSWLVALFSVVVGFDNVCLVYTGDGELDGFVSEPCNQRHLVRRDEEGDVVQGVGSKVRWVLECDLERYGGRCGKIKNALVLMARFLENVFVIKHLNIKATFMSFCEKKKICNTGNLGLSTSSRFIRISEDNVNIFYPQPLFNHKFPTEAKNQQPFDMYVDLNSDADFYFPDDYFREQRSTQPAFMDTLVHEVNHGLGFLSSLKCRIPRVVIPLYSTITRITTNASGITSTKQLLFAFNAFDKHILVSDANKTIFEYAKEVNRLGPLDVVGETSTAELLTTCPHRKVFDEITRFADTPQNFVFQTSNNISVPLETRILSRGFAPSHMDNETYVNSKDSTMRAKRNQGTGIHNMFNKTQKWITSPYGPDIQAVFTTLGYSLNPEPKYENSMEYHYFLHHLKPQTST